MLGYIVRLALLACAVAGLDTLAYGQETKPDIVIILADDLGNADLGYRGSDIKTPNIDKLANEGVRLESFYGMPVCTPARVLALAGAKGSPDHPFDGKNIWPTLAEGQASAHEDILINVEAFRGAIRKDNWKLIRIALLPGKTELFDLSKDPGEHENLADRFPEVVNDLQARLVAYAKQQKPSFWIKAQPAFLGAQGKTIFDPDFDIDDSGLPHERVQLPK
jgi:arylsulfatase A-like enzyme